MPLDWDRLLRSPPTFFPWDEVRAAWVARDGSLGGVPVEMAQELLGDKTHGCEGCGAAPRQLAWVFIGTSEKAWAGGDERCGWVTICAACARQVDFVLDEELTDLRRDGNW